jgi:hypothetical protein
MQFCDYNLSRHNLTRLAEISLMLGYTVVDLLGTLEAAALLILFLLPPGFLLGQASNVLGFRGRSAAERFLWSIVLSLSVSPILAVLLVRFCSLTVAVSLFLLAAAAALLLVGRELLSAKSKSWRPDRTTWVALCMMVLWAGLALFTLVDLQFGDRLYLPYSAFDHSIRTMLVDAVARTGVPPRNPLYGLGGAPVLRYYYYWYVLCALPVHLAGLSPRASLNGSVLWSGFALAALIPLYLKHLFEERENLRFKSIVGIGLLLVTGYDLIPFVALSRWLGALWGDMEWWDTNQVTSWLGSLIWVPHHVASLTACLTGFLLLIALRDDAGNRDRIWTALLAGAAFSSAAGLSVYVTFVFAAFTVVWVLTLLFVKRPEVFFTYVGAGAFSILLALPYLEDLRAPSKVGGRFAFFMFRDYPPAQAWLKFHGVTNALALNLSQVPTLILVYFFEFGVFFLVGCYCLRREMRNHWKIPFRQRAAWVMFSVSLLLVSVAASDSTGVNDLGFRGILVLQFVLLAWAAPVVSELFLPEGRSRLGLAWKIALSVSLLVGAIGTLTQLAVLRFYEPIVDAGKSRRTEEWMGPSPNLGKHTFRIRQSIERLKRYTPRSSVLQYNPRGADVFLFHLYADRQAAAGDDSCGATFGGDPQKCEQALRYIDAAFNSPNATRTWNMDQFCDAYQINLLVATNSDPVWKDGGSWVWTRSPLLANDTLRAFTCGAPK